MLQRALIFLAFYFNTTVVLAYGHVNPGKGSYGYIANNMMEPISGITYLMQTAALMCGVGMITGAFFKAIEWRRNPAHVTIGVPLTMFITGIGLIVLKFIPFVGI